VQLEEEYATNTKFVVSFSCMKPASSQSHVTQDSASLAYCCICSPSLKVVCTVFIVVTTFLFISVYPHKALSLWNMTFCG